MIFRFLVKFYIRTSLLSSLIKWKYAIQHSAIPLPHSSAKIDPEANPLDFHAENGDPPAFNAENGENGDPPAFICDFWRDPPHFRP